MRELLQTGNRAFVQNGVPTTSRQTSATRTDTTSRLPISLGSTNKRYEPSTHLRPAAKESKEYVILFPRGGGEHDRGRNRPRSERLGLELAGSDRQHQEEDAWACLHYFAGTPTAKVSDFLGLNCAKSRPNFRVLGTSGRKPAVIKFPRLREIGNPQVNVIKKMSGHV